MADPIDDLTAALLGVRMGDLFALAKELVELSPAEIEAVLEPELPGPTTGGPAAPRSTRRTRSSGQLRSRLWRAKPIRLWAKSAAPGIMTQ